MYDAVGPILAAAGSFDQWPLLALSACVSIAAAALYHTIAGRSSGRGTRRSIQAAADASGSDDLTEIRGRIAVLEAASARTLQCVGFVRFNAFPDVGSELSYALAVVDRRGNGFIVSSIYSREEVRTYAKAVRNFTADKGLSDEEQRAVELTRLQAQQPLVDR